MKRVVLLCLALVCAALVATPAAVAEVVEPPDRVDRVDLYVLLDRSGSMTTEITTIKNNLATVVHSLQCAPRGAGAPDTCIPDLWAGAGTVGYAGSGSAAFQNWVDVQPAPSFAAVPTSEPTGCCSEPLTFAADAAVTGEGGAAYGLASVPPRTTCAGSPAASSGYETFGYPCFRDGALPIVVLATDEAPLTGATTWHQPSWGTVVKPAMLERGARLVGIVGDGAEPATTTDLRQMATDTGAVGGDGTPLVLAGGGANAAAAIQDAILELVDAAVPPTVTMTAPHGEVQLAPDAVATWTAADGNGFGLANHDVRYRRAAYDEGFGEPVSPDAWQTLPATTTSVTGRLRPGELSCFSARTTDRIGHTSPWAAEACASRALDDRALTVASKGWRKGTGRAYYLRTFRQATRRGATLTLAGVRASSVTLVATTCPGCGKVSVAIGRVRFDSVSLRSATRRNQRLITVPSLDLGVLTGKLRITVVSSDRPVTIDGVGFGRG